MPGFDLGKVDPRDSQDAVPGLLKKAEDMARESMRETGEISPLLLMETRDGQQLALALKNPNGPIRQLIPMLRTLAQQQDAHAGALLIETWAAPFVSDVRPSLSDQKWEMVLITGLADRICTTLAFDIDRDGSGVTLSRVDDCKDTVTSPWAAIFDDAVWEELATPMN